MLDIQARDIRRDLNQILLGNLRCGLVYDFLQSVFITPILGPESGQSFPNAHQITRSEQCVPPKILEYVFLQPSVDIRDRCSAEECLHGICTQLLGTNHPIGLLQPNILNEYLSETFDRIRDVDGAASILLSHHRRLEARIRLLPYRREDLEAMVDPPKLVGNLDKAKLGKVPYVR